MPNASEIAWHSARLSWAANHVASSGSSVRPSAPHTSSQAWPQESSSKHHCVPSTILHVPPKSPSSTQVPEQPSSDTLLPSSQLSSATRFCVPSPHDTAVQSLSHETVSPPSSQVSSWLSLTIESPHTGSVQSPSQSNDSPPSSHSSPAAWLIVSSPQSTKVQSSSHVADSPASSHSSSPSTAPLPHSPVLPSLLLDSCGDSSLDSAGSVVLVPELSTAVAPLDESAPSLDVPVGHASPHVESPDASNVGFVGSVMVAGVSPSELALPDVSPVSSSS